MVFIRKFLIFRKIYHKFGSFAQCGHQILLKHGRIIKPQLLLVASPAYAVKIEGQTDEIGQEGGNLEPKILLRNAAICAVDAATSLLTHSTCRLLQLELEYAEALQDLVLLLEANAASLDSVYQQNQIWDAILSVRHRANQIKLQKLETEAVYHCAVSMMESAAEAAHASGAEYAGIAGSERAFSAKSQVSHASEKCRELEQRLSREEAKNIEAVAKHEEKRRDKELNGQEERAEEEESDTGENESEENETVKSESGESKSDSKEDEDIRNIDLSKL